MNDLTPEVQRILSLDRQVQRLIYAASPESYAQITWPVVAVKALLLIESDFAHTPSGVADALKVSRTAMTGILDRLEEDGLITRTIDPSDRRCFTLAVTEAGRETVRRIDAVRRSPLASALQRMEKTDVESLARGLDALVQAMCANQTDKQSDGKDS